MPASRRDEDDASRPRRRKPEPEPNDNYEDEEPAPVKKKKKTKKELRREKREKTTKLILWGGGGLVGLIALVAVVWISVKSYTPAAATMNGISWYKAPNTLNRFDILFPGGTPSHDLITLRNPATDVKMRAELWQKRFQGRMYEACYISGDNVSAANINGAAQNMRNSPPPDPNAKSWQSEIVLNDGGRTIVMRVYGPDQIDKDDPMVRSFFEAFKLTS